jgi:5,10-methylenetetrahydrofolate reductase|tara:strand:+ start:1461 stop:2339 length:879 start_codon:yes stop_codon:yes gene_type:complete
LSKLSTNLKSGKFTVTCELNPPKGTDLEKLFKKADMLKDRVVAINITDSAGSNMTMAPIAVSHFLKHRGIEPILQITGRDRNRIAIQADLIAASALGITNILTMSGDPPQHGDHPEAKPVFDLNSTQVLDAMKSMQTGKDLGKNALEGNPEFFRGAVVNPGAKDLETEFVKMEEKVSSGAQFFQTQAIFEPDALEKFMITAKKFDVPILAGIIVLKSTKMANYLNSYLPGISIPENIIKSLDLSDRDAIKKESISITANIIKEIQDMCDGIHVMAIGWENTIPNILDESKII